MQIKRIKTNGYIDTLLTIDRNDLSYIVSRYKLPLDQVKEFIYSIKRSGFITVYLCIEKFNNKYQFFLEY